MPLTVQPAARKRGWCISRQAWMRACGFDEVWGELFFNIWPRLCAYLTMALRMGVFCVFVCFVSEFCVDGVLGMPLGAPGLRSSCAACSMRLEVVALDGHGEPDLVELDGAL
jgi:hypothetical protein